MKKIFKSIGYGLSVGFVLIAILFGLLFALRKAKKYKKEPNSVFLQDRQKTVYKLFKKFLYVKRIKVDVKDVDKLPTKQMLFIANHKSIYDPMVIFQALYEAEKLGPISFICKNELSKKWHTRCVIELMDGIFIQRDDGRSIYECFLKQTENVKKGYSIAVFPEGTRVPGDNFLPFNPTTLKVAFQNFVSIAPAAIYGADLKRKFGNEKIIKVCFLKPIQPNNFINIKPEQLMSSIQSDVVANYNHMKLELLEKSK